ncbi:hypothetical protein TRIUR3_34368 [Triticum urartu]|uniref:Uncharacterized protein n=1 Tax=Triticum urartu TaxID=4572 RepID=M8AR50_TRIUA|nr:hypothetical protein TRIUR3_34368 [Triticum urartu]
MVAAAATTARARSDDEVGYVLRGGKRGEGLDGALIGRLKKACESLVVHEGDGAAQRSSGEEGMVEVVPEDAVAPDWFQWPESKQRTAPHLADMLVEHGEARGRLRSRPQLRWIWGERGRGAGVGKISGGGRRADEADGTLPYPLSAAGTRGRRAGSARTAGAPRSASPVARWKATEGEVGSG